MKGQTSDTQAGIVAIAGNILIMFTLGHFYTVAASLATQGIVMPLSGLITLKLGFRVIVISSCLLTSAGLFFSYLSINIGFGCFLFTYAIMVGTGIGFAYGLLLSIGASWFPKHRGLIVGLCACGYGAGAIVLTPVQTALINPDNISVNNQTQMFEDDELLHRIPITFLIIGGILAGMQLIGCLTVRPRPIKSSSPLPDETNVISEAKTANSVSSVPLEVETTLSPRMVLRMLDLYIFWGLMLLTLIPFTLVTSAMKIVGQKSFPDDVFLSIVATVSAVCNTVFRIGWGPLGDKLSFKLPLCINNLFYSTVLLTFPFVSAVPTAGRYLYAIWTILMFICIGGNFVLLPFGVSKAFGHKYFATNYGIVFTALTPGSILAAVLVSVVTLEQHTMGIFLGCGCIIFAVGILSLMLVDEQAPSWLKRISRRQGKIIQDSDMQL